MSSSVAGAGDVHQAILSRASDLVDLAARLVAVPTENPPGRSYPECVELLADALDGLGLDVERVELDEGRAALFAGVGEGPTLYLHGHYDVVPASDPRQFQPRVEGDRLIGRGSADMKGALAAMAYAVHALADAPLSGRVELAFVPDEETGGAAGSRKLLASGRLGRNGIGAVLGEPTSGVIWNAHRGAATAQVTVRGRPAHVGLQHRGVNAFEAALPILAGLAALKREVEARRTRFAIEPDEARRSILMLGGDVSGGSQFNVVPPAFSFSIERRFNPEEELAAERERVRATIAGAADGVDVDVRWLQEAVASGVGEDEPLVRALRDAVVAVGGEEPSCRLCPGLLESRFYSEAGVPACAYGPGELEVSHGPDESVSLERLVACARVYAELALDRLRPDVTREE